MERERALEKCPERSSLFELFFIVTVKLLARSYLILSSISFNSNPLFSMVVSFYCLILLYLPHLFLSFLFSPVLISTGILLATLLRFGSIQQENVEIILPEIEKPDLKDEEPYRVQSPADLGLAQQEKDAIFTQEIDQNDPKEDVENRVESKKGPVTDMGFVRIVDFSKTFVEWNRSRPLEIIYEEYEGEEDEDSPDKERRRGGIDGLLSSDCSDSDSSEGEFPEEFPAWDTPENLCFRWEEREGLIEIPLGLKPTVGFEAEEENLIEINLFGK